MPDPLRAVDMPAANLALRHLFKQVRATTTQLTAPLDPEDCCVQSMPDASPAKWHLAHTTWFFETFILEQHEPRFEPFHPAFRVLYNSYYNAVGNMHARPERGLVTRPTLAQVLAYRENVDRRMCRLLDRKMPDSDVADLVRLGLEHEQQHQELLLTDLKHLFSRNPLLPGYQPQSTQPAPAPEPLEWLAHPGGIGEIGHAGPGFSFDNERPRHRVCLTPFLLANRLVSNGEYAAFIEDGGYRNPAHWLSDGWHWVQTQGIRHPIYWLEDAGSFREFTLRGVEPLSPGLPVVHLSLYEADAYARWAGARLPRETEWEVMAASLPVTGNFQESGILHPIPCNTNGLAQMFGDAWEWTQSDYAPYPGFRVAPGAVGEYNGKFMVNQYVLRGGSCATPGGHVRPSYRNFFPAPARWQFTGLRLARDAG